MSGGHDPQDDRAHWAARYLERGDEIEHAPSSWIVKRALALPRETVFVDVAGGTGRHAAPIARAGRTVVVLDFVPRAVSTAVERHDNVLGVVADVRALPVRRASVGAILCVSFLDRAVFGALAEMLVPGGVLLYETFTLAHLDVVERGRARGPRNPAYLLAPGELPALVAPLAVIEHEERFIIDETGERHVARVMAVRR